LLPHFPPDRQILVEIALFLFLPLRSMFVAMVKSLTTVNRQILVLPVWKICLWTRSIVNGGTAMEDAAAADRFREPTVIATSSRLEFSQ
jgi:hypothetical protein